MKVNAGRAFGRQSASRGGTTLSQDELNNDPMPAGSPEGIDSIPLADGDCAGSFIVPDGRDGPETHALRGRRASPRMRYAGTRVLFSIATEQDRTDQADCPLVDISQRGIAVYYDHPLKPGVKGHVSFRSACDMPVRAALTVRRCIDVGEKLFLIGCQFDVKLRIEDRKPARGRAGPASLLGVSARKIREPSGLPGHSLLSVSSIPLFSLPPSADRVLPRDHDEAPIPFADEE